MFFRMMNTNQVKLICAATAVGFGIAAYPAKALGEAVVNEPIRAAGTAIERMKPREPGSADFALASFEHACPECKLLDAMRPAEPFATENCDLPAIKAFRDAEMAGPRGRRTYLKRVIIRSADGSNQVSPVARAKIFQLLQDLSTDPSLMGAYSIPKAESCEKISMAVSLMKVTRSEDEGKTVVLAPFLDEPVAGYGERIKNVRDDYFKESAIPTPPKMVSIELKGKEGNQELIIRERSNVHVFHDCPDGETFSEKAEVITERVIAWGKDLPNEVSVDAAVLSGDYLSSVASFNLAGSGLGGNLACLPISRSVTKEDGSIGYEVDQEATRELRRRYSGESSASSAR